MAELKIGVIMSTTRQGRFCDQATDWIMKLAQGNDGARFERIDLRDYPLPFFDAPLAPVWAPAENEVAKRWNAKVAEFDGYIFVTAEYNHGVPGVLKNALDYSFPAFNRKPAAFVGYGGVGAARAIEQLRLIAVELDMAPMRNAVHVGLNEFLGILQNGKTFDDYPYLAESAQRLFDHLLWWAEALKHGWDRVSTGS